MNSKHRSRLGKRGARAARAAGLVLAGSSALAQQAPSASDSSAQLYGLVSAGVTYKNHQAGGGHATDMSNSLLSSSLFGLRGREDLGDGFGAQFRLESGINTNTGTAGGTGKFWNRQSYVGLDWKRQVVLTVGRQFSASTDRVVQSLDVYNVSGPSLDTQPLAVFGVNRYASNDTRVDNSIKLRVNGPTGTTAAVNVGLNDGTGRNYSFDLAQLTPAYTVGVYGTRYEAPTVIAATGVQPVHQVFGAGAQLPVGDAAFYLNAVRSTLDSTTAGRLQQGNDIVSVGIRYIVSNVVLKGAYIHDKGSDLNGVAGRDGLKKTWVLSSEYRFSRRTSVYVAAYDNRFTDGYKLESLNIAGMNRDPAASSLGGYSVGLRNEF